MEKELASFKSIMKSFMVLIVTALAMGETLALAPDLLKGNQMVASVFEVMDRKSGITGDVGEELKTVEGTIELKRINFSYPSRPDVIIFKDFNLRVPAGKSVALVGQSGSGKSFVISLILRFFDPVSGRVLVDEPALFATLIYENILYGKEGASDSEVIEAAKLANAHNFISGLLEGYSTTVVFPPHL
ncbi:ABC transporter B family member 10-like [Vigna angularis]|uniref:ABC transporter B family member 10-like n=1 Tax=Phaseolus angularis TaxID=3914 RepID=UPI0022B57FF3|nr:ABC transporter B family member 10-like [Vigna angularis]XP_052732387.1 ABC transporter B family member 10-like [Vigna angularis]